MKYKCLICGQIIDNPNECPICHAKANKIVPYEEGNVTWADEHTIGVAIGVEEEVFQGLKDHFTGECMEVGIYLAMARQAYREGYPEIATLFEKIAHEEAEHAAKFQEMLGEHLYPDTKKNLEKMIAGENGAGHGKLAIAKKAKALNLDAIHDTVHEMCKDEARHGKAMQGVLDRYFK